VLGTASTLIVDVGVGDTGYTVIARARLGLTVGARPSPPIASTIAASVTSEDMSARSSRTRPKPPELTVVDVRFTGQARDLRCNRMPKGIVQVSVVMQRDG
jgi:hypothetical protein